MNRSEARRLRELEWERAALRTALERERRRLSDLEERRRELEARHRGDLERIAQLSQAIDARCAQDAWNLGPRAREIEQEIARYGDSELASLVSRAREVLESTRQEQQAVQVQLNTAEAKLRDIMRRDAHNAGAIVRGIEGVLASTGDSELAQMQGSNPIETQKIEAERLHRRLRQLRLEAERRALAADIYEREVVKRRTSKPQAEIQAIDGEATTLRAQLAETERRLNAVEAEIAELQTDTLQPGQAEQLAGTWRLLWLLTGGWYWELWRRRWGSSPASALFAFLSLIVVGVGANFLIALISSRQGEFAPTQISQPALSTPISTGQLTIESSPAGARVYVDNAYVGNTGSRIKVRSGNVRFTVRKSGFKDHTESVNLSPGETKVLSISLEPVPSPPPPSPSQKAASGAPPAWPATAAPSPPPPPPSQEGVLVITGPAGAEVYLNGKYYCCLPLKLKLKPGEYELVNSTRTWGVVVIVTGGRTHRVTVPQ
jgi:hypothetical protein